MTALHLQFHPMHTPRHHMALSPIGYLVSSFGGLVAGVGVAFLIWHLF